MELKLANYTDRFITLPIKVYNTKMADLVGQEKADERDCNYELDITRIIGYRNTFDKDGNITYVVVEIEGADNYINVYVKDVDEFELLLNEHAKNKLIWHFQ